MVNLFGGFQKNYVFLGGRRSSSSPAGHLGQRQPGPAENVRRHPAASGPGDDNDDDLNDDGDNDNNSWPRACRRPVPRRKRMMTAGRAAASLRRGTPRWRPTMCRTPCCPTWRTWTRTRRRTGGRRPPPPPATNRPSKATRFFSLLF